jgi:heat shock protein HslJ
LRLSPFARDPYDGPMVRVRSWLGVLAAAIVLFVLGFSTGPAVAAAKRVVTLNAIRGRWNLIQVDGLPATTFEQTLGVTFQPGVGSRPVSTSDGCNGFWWPSMQLEKSGSLQTDGLAVGTKRACPHRPRSRVIIDTLSSSAAVRLVDSDLFLDGAHKLQFRLTVPAWPSLPTIESLTGKWSGSSFNGLPLGALHNLQFGVRSEVEAAQQPCAGMFIERFSFDARGLLTLESQPETIPECVEPVDDKLRSLIVSHPLVELSGARLQLRSPMNLAEFSTTLRNGLPPPSGVQPARPAIPATSKSATGDWTVESINGMSAAPGMSLHFPDASRTGFSGFDGCNTFSKSATTTKKAQPVIAADGSVHAWPLLATYKACSEDGFQWDQRVRNIFESMPIAEHVDSRVVLRTPSTDWSPGIWITLRKTST